MIMTSLCSITGNRSWSTGLIAAAIAIFAIPAAHAQQSFKTPEEAAAALATAVKSGATKEMLKVLGPDAAEVVDSGDSVADAETREKFRSAYDAKHSVSFEGDKKAVLIVGPDDFPFPIPLTRDRSGWEFDTAAGRIEILYRRIGRNEGDESPLGELAAEASAEGYKTGGEPQPFHGYYYRILTRQGLNAPGGELNYVVNGKMIGGFALVAYPAEYGNSGVMTFVVNHAGTVYQKDLGERTAAIAKRMTAFDPDQTWKKVEVSSP
jgi:hypothetical protein